MRFSPYLLRRHSRRSEAWVVEAELQPAHLQAVAEEHPKRRVLQFLAQGPEHLVPRVRSVVICELLERVGLGGFEESPELVFGNEMLGVRDVGLFEHAIPVLADEEIRDVLLKGQLRWFSFVWAWSVLCRLQSRPGQTHRLVKFLFQFLFRQGLCPVG